MEQILEHPGEKECRLVVFLDNVSPTSGMGKEGVDGSSPSEGFAKAPPLRRGKSGGKTSSVRTRATERAPSDRAMVVAS
jgi:hypothetical protein